MQIKWLEEEPFCLDMNNEMFGGPFTKEEVEDVITFIRLLPLMEMYPVDFYAWDLPGCICHH